MCQEVNILETHQEGGHPIWKDWNVGTGISRVVLRKPQNPRGSGTVYTPLRPPDSPRSFCRCPPAGWSLPGPDHCFPQGQQCRRWAQTNGEKRGMQDFRGFLVSTDCEFILVVSSWVLNLGSTEPPKEEQWGWEAWEPPDLVNKILNGCVYKCICLGRSFIVFIKFLIETVTLLKTLRTPNYRP